MKKKKLMIIATFVGVLILLTVIIVGVIWMNRNNNGGAMQQQSVSKDISKIMDDFRQNKFDDAISKIDSLLANDSNNTNLLLLKADILLSKGSAKFLEKEFALKAQEILNKVLKLDPENVKAYRLMGYSYEIQNLFDEAIVNYDKSLAIKETSEAYNWKGHTYDLKGDMTKAEEFYKKAIKLDDNNQMALRNLSRIHLRRGEKVEARKILEKLIKMPVDNITTVAGDYHSLGTIEFDEKNIDKAKELFEKALELDPSFMLARIELAKYKILFEGKKDEAIADLTDVIKDYPKQVFPLEWLGYAYLENDEFDKSIDTLKKARSLTSSDITLMGEQRILIRSRLNYYLSMAYSLSGDSKQAKEHILKTMEGTDKSTMTMLIGSLREGKNGPYKNIMSDPEISSLADELINL